MLFSCILIFIIFNFNFILLFKFLMCTAFVNVQGDGEDALSWGSPCVDYPHRSLLKRLQRYGPI